MGVILNYVRNNFQNTNRLKMLFDMPTSPPDHTEVSAYHIRSNIGDRGFWWSDSLALLHILNQILPRQGVSLHVATLDHQLRGAESAADVRYVGQVCHELGVPFTIGSTDVEALAREHQLGI